VFEEAFLNLKSALMMIGKAPSDFTPSRFLNFRSIYIGSGPADGPADLNTECMGMTALWMVLFHVDSGTCTPIGSGEERNTISIHFSKKKQDQGSNKHNIRWFVSLALPLLILPL
jgi:hypothetical protein